MKLLKLTSIEITTYILLLLLFTIGIYFAQTNLNYFDTKYTQEDGLVEYATAFFLLFSACMLLYRLVTLSKFKNILWKIGILAIAIVFIFGAGEEISWGQRIFNVESSEFFIENNAQGETNLHNLVVGETKVNKLIFSQLLTLILVLYLIITPILYKKVSIIKKLADLFAVPIVKWHHTAAFLVGTALLVFIPSDRKWELYELAFSLIFLLIFLNPVNKHIYKSNL
jgi:hypothetical protein